MIDTFATAMTTGPAALLLDGEPGIGKTTLWRIARQVAAGRGAHVLSTRSARAEKTLSYAVLADLLAAAPPAALSGAPDPQRQTLEAVRHGVLTTDEPRAVYIAFLSVLAALADTGPVLVAIDDAQWVDRTSWHALLFVSRRLRTPVGLLLTFRTAGADSRRLREFASEYEGGSLIRLSLPPLSAEAVHRLLSERSQRPLSPTSRRWILATAAGNPLYALELAAASPPRTPPGSDWTLPPALRDLTGARFARLPASCRQALTAAAATGEPTLAQLARVVTGGGPLADRLEPAERAGIVAIAQGRVRFTHPLLAEAIYRSVPPSQRRSLHHALSQVVDTREERARHLALATFGQDPAVASKLVRAARDAHARGAPGTAADLLDLALELGPPRPDRRLLAATYRFAAGDLEDAATAAQLAASTSSPGLTRARALLLMADLQHQSTAGQPPWVPLAEARQQPDLDADAAARIGLASAWASTAGGRTTTAVMDAQHALAHALRTGDRGLRAQAEAAIVVTEFLAGRGLDRRRLDRALALEDPDRVTPVELTPTFIHGFLNECVGDFTAARQTMLELRTRLLRRGRGASLPIMAYHLTTLHLGTGDVPSATRWVDDITAIATQLGGHAPLGHALTARALLDAHTGRLDLARAAGQQAIIHYRACGWDTFALWPTTVLGHLDLSLGGIASAHATLGPLVDRAAAHGLTEPQAMPFLADDIEALIGLGQTQRAALLNQPLLDSALRWPRATGLRAHAQLLAGRGRIAEAEEAAHEAVAGHEAAGTHLDHARSMLTLGRIQRRARHRAAAARTLNAATDLFTSLGAVLWARQARTELGRTGIHTADPRTLTNTERRIVALAATGLTNRQIAAAAFISAKTVEANLTRAYRKLGINTRAQLATYAGNRPDPNEDVAPL